MEHMHKAVIIAWANGAKIQYKPPHSPVWYDVGLPTWGEEWEYRIKPTPKPDKVIFVEIVHNGMGPFSSDVEPYHNLKLIYDGETGKLKSAESINHENS